MKNLLSIIIILLIGLSLTKGQNDSIQLYQASKDDIIIGYIEMKKNSAVAFKLGRWMDKIDEGYLINYTDTLTKQNETSDYIFIGEKTKIQQGNNNKYVYFIDKNPKRTKKHELTLVNDNKLAYKNLNNGYWFSSFLKLCDTINSLFPWQLYYNSGFDFWSSFENKEIQHIKFRNFADTTIVNIKDSISKANTLYTIVTNNLLNNISTINYFALRDSLKILPIEYPGRSSYFGKVIKAISIYRPELVFKLADDMPERKSNIFVSIDKNKETINKLKLVETDSPAKAEFFKRRKEGRTENIRTLVYLSTFIGIVIYIILK